MALEICGDQAIFMPEEQCDSCEQFQSDVARLDQAVSGLSNRIDAVNTALAGKQNTLTFDTAPTDGSANPVKSDGVYDRFVKSDSNIAPIETNPASAAHAVGEWIMYNGSLYRVTAAIAQGDALTIGGNVARGVLTGDGSAPVPLLPDPTIISSTPATFAVDLSTYSFAIVYIRAGNVGFAVQYLPLLPQGISDELPWSVSRVHATDVNYSLSATGKLTRSAVTVTSTSLGRNATSEMQIQVYGLL